MTAAKEARRWRKGGKQRRKGGGKGGKGECGGGMSAGRCGIYESKGGMRKYLAEKQRVRAECRPSAIKTPY